LRREIGKGGAELIRDFVRPGERHFLGDAMGKVQTRIYLSGFERDVRPFPGAAAAVRRMRASGIPVVLASSADRRVVERSLRRARLSGVLTGFICADDVRKAKPFHDVFSLAIRRFRLARRDPVAIGDTPYDIAAAHQIGLPCIALLSGGFPLSSRASAEARFEGLARHWSSGRSLFQ
jgi:beta-phosphoglucomutase-like phosphatase (HAD superfamily)